MYIYVPFFSFAFCCHARVEHKSPRVFPVPVGISNKAPCFPDKELIIYNTDNTTNYSKGTAEITKGTAICKECKEYSTPLILKYLC